MQLDIIIPVFNADQTITVLLRSIETQNKDKVSVNVIAVNDASTDQSLQILHEFHAKTFGLEIIELTKNMGRANALNVGSGVARGDALLFIDADCYFKDKDNLLSLTRAFNEGKRVCFGALYDPGQDIWADYFNRSQKRKIAGEPWTFSSTNMLCDRALFHRAGGFFQGYTHYGFEDRDLIIHLCSELSDPKKIAFVNDAILNHRHQESIASYCTKMFLSGKHSARVFAMRHPETYRKMSYRKFDANHINALRRAVLDSMLLVMRPMKSWTKEEPRSDTALSRRIRIFTLRVFAALSFYEGTKEARLQPAQKESP